MDLFSYLLGKKKGGGGTTGLDWKTLGYEIAPKNIIKSYNYSKHIQDVFVPADDLSFKFKNDITIEYMPTLDTSNTTNTRCMFQYCSNLISVALFDTKKVLNMSSMFDGCNNLKDVPVFDTSGVLRLNMMFNSCTKLTDDSLNNILKMCINATSYTDTKTLLYLGIQSKSTYPVSRIEALPHYQDFINAGWTIGY